MDSWSRPRFKSLFWPHWLVCFRSCWKRSRRAHRDCHFVYQFLWGYVHSYRTRLTYNNVNETIFHCKITGLNDYRHMSLTSVVMKSFERLVLAYLKASTGPLLDPLQFAYRANRCVDDAVNMGLHYVLQHLDRPGTYVRILFVDFSSTFNTIIPDTLQNKLTQLSVPTFICQWINSILTDRQQLVKLGKFSSSTRTISTGAPQCCVHSSLLFSLYINDSTSKDSSVKLMKSSRTVTSLLTDRKLRSWLSGAVLTTLSLTRSKQWRWSWTLGETPLFSLHSPSWTALWLQWSHSDSWAPQFLRTCTAKKCEKGPAEAYFLRQLRKFHLPQELLIQFYSAIIESVLCTAITVRFSSATKSDLRRLRRVVRTAERIIVQPPHSPRTVLIQSEQKSW